MSVTVADAIKTATRPLTVGLFKEIIKYDELFSVLPFEGVAGESLRYNREKALPAAEFIDPDAGTTTESSATTDEVLVPIRTLSTDLDIPLLTKVAQQGQNNMEAMQFAAKAKAIGHKISNALINGGFVTSFTVNRPVGWNGVYVDAATFGAHQDTKRYGKAYFRYTNAGTLLEYKAPGDREYGPAVACAADGAFTLRSDNPNKWVRVTLDVSDADEDGLVEVTFASTTQEPDGLEIMIEPGSTQEIASSGADGDPFTISKLDKLITKVTVGTRRVFFMNGSMIEAYYAAYRALGGTDPQHIQLPGYSGDPTPTYRGIPILRNDSVLLDESKGARTDLSSIYLCGLGGEGLSALYTGGESQTISADPRDKPVLGFMIEKVGPVQNAPKDRTRFHWFGAFVLRSSKAVARASQIQPPA